MKAKFVIFMVSVIFVVLPAGARAQREPTGGPLLLKPTTQKGTIPEKRDPTVTRSQNVTVRIELLRSSDGRNLTVPVFGGAKLSVIRDSVETTVKNGFVWSGHVANQRGSAATFSVVGEVVEGNITTTTGKIYQIRYAGGGVHTLREIDQSKFPPEGPSSVPKFSSHTKEEADTCSTDPPGEIDAMVVYTATTRAAAGGTDAMLATIYLALSEANQSYLNSNISQRLRLVHTEEVNYAESGNIQTDRDRLQNPTDGIMDNVPTLRNTYAADVVALIQEDGGGYCGISFIMSPVSNAFEPFGYAVVARSCATGNYSFAHELGHVMGARHDWYADSTNNSAYAFNHGYVNKTPTAPAAPWRTIMAYNNDCSDGGINCTRLPYWSNPNVNYPVGGDPMGVASGGQQSDNHQVLNNTALTVANFRCSSPTANNVWMKDTWDDTGAEPDPHTVSEDMWKSPYIWVRNSQDTTLVHQHQHQDPILGQTNWIYTKLHNGSGATSGNLEIYWANGSTALSWPADWHLLHSTPVNFAGHSTTIVETQWTGLPGTGHFCLLARWNSPSDPMAFPETANLEQNVRQNNNLVWRNLDIVDLGHDTAADETFIVRNVNREARGIYSLIVRSPKNEVGNSFIRYGRVTVQFDKLLMKAWQEGGSKGTGFKMDGPLAVVVDPNGAVFENLIMAPSGAGQIRLNFKKSPSTPKRTYIVDTVQMGQGKNPVVGGMSFEIHTDQLPK